jgi:hypothetical protein
VQHEADDNVRPVFAWNTCYAPGTGWMFLSMMSQPRTSISMRSQHRYTERRANLVLLLWHTHMLSTVPEAWSKYSQAHSQRCDGPDGEHTSKEGPGTRSRRQWQLQRGLQGASCHREAREPSSLPLHPATMRLIAPRALASSTQSS